MVPVNVLPQLRSPRHLPWLVLVVVGPRVEAAVVQGGDEACRISTSAVSVPMDTTVTTTSPAVVPRARNWSLAWSLATWRAETAATPAKRSLAS